MSKMQELIKKYQQSDKDEKVLTEIIREIQTCEMLWVAFSPITKNFFVDLVQGSPTVFLFSEKEYCEAYCKHMKSKSNNTLGIVECPKKARLSIFSTSGQKPGPSSRYIRSTFSHFSSSSAASGS